MSLMHTGHGANQKPWNEAMMIKFLKYFSLYNFGCLKYQFNIIGISVIIAFIYAFLKCCKMDFSSKPFWMYDHDGWLLEKDAIQ